MYFSNITIGGEGIPPAAAGENLLDIVKDTVKHCSNVELADHELRHVYRFCQIFLYFGGGGVQGMMGADVTLQIWWRLYLLATTWNLFFSASKSIIPPFSFFVKHKHGLHSVLFEYDDSTQLSFKVRLQGPTYSSRVSQLFCYVRNKKQSPYVSQINVLIVYIFFNASLQILWCWKSWRKECVD